MTKTVIRRLTQQWALVVVIAFCLGAIAASPHIRALTAIDSDAFRGVHAPFSDDEVYYQARIKEVVDGHITIGNPYLYEHQDAPFIMPPLAEWTYAAIAKYRNLSVPATTILADILLTAVNFVLLYLIFVNFLHQRKYLALLYATLFVLLFIGTFGRPISPQFNSIFFLLGVLTLVKIYTDTAITRRLHSLAGAITGLTCFLSPYHFTTLLVMYFIPASISFLRVRTRDKIIHALWYIGSLLPFTLMYAALQLESSKHPFYAEAVLRYGLIDSHIPGAYTNILMATLVSICLLLSRKLIALDRFYLLLACILGIIALNWQNVITGKSLQFSSHYLFSTILLSLLVIASIHASLTVAPKHVQRIKVSAYASIFVVLAFVGFNQSDVFLSSFTNPYPKAELLEMQQKNTVFSWLNENSEPDSVVMTLGSDFSFLIPIYTDNKVFYNFYATLFNVSNEETENRWLTEKLFTPNLSRETIIAEQRFFWGNTYIDSYQSREVRSKLISKLRGQPYTPSTQIPETEVERMLAKWRLLQSTDITEHLETYRLDYILLSSDFIHYEYARNILEKQLSLQPTVLEGGARVYRYK